MQFRKNALEVWNSAPLIWAIIVVISFSYSTLYSSLREFDTNSYYVIWSLQDALQIIRELTDFFKPCFHQKGRLHFIYAKLDTAKVASYLWSLQCIPQNACMQFKKMHWKYETLLLYTLCMATWYVPTTVNNNMHILFIIVDPFHMACFTYTLFFPSYMPSLGEKNVFPLTDVFVFVGNSYDRLSALPVNISLLLYLLLNLKLWT